MEGAREREVTCMKADGNCYFYVVTATGGVQDDVAAEAGGPSGLRHAAELRRQAAEYIRANPDEFKAVSLAAAADDPGGYARYTEAAPGGGVRLADSQGAAGRLASWLERDSAEEAPATARRARTAVYFFFGAQRGPDAPVGVVYELSLVTVWQDGVRKLRRGSVAAASLAGALLTPMRTGDMKILLLLADSLSRLLGERALEDGLDEAWRTACALNLPLSEDMEFYVVSNLVLFRYDLSQEDPTSDVPPAADAHERWHELWARVAMLQEYSRRLQDDLERLQCDDGAPGCADLSVMLVRLCALALRNAKRSFAATYKDVPWEEMEYLLVMFIEGRTVRVTLAHRVANVQSTAAHLRCFRERVEKYVMVHRAEPDPEVAMKRLKKEPRKERAVILAGVVGGALTDLRKDFALLMDWHSLTEITETLGTASEALDRLEDADWAAWGWLALRWALFVVGERVKYSWTSPNLSPRWAGLIEAMAPGGVLKIMSTIRDDQEHGKDGSNAKTLALSEMRKSERKKLREELLKLENAARAALEAAGSEVECSDDNDWDGQDRVAATMRDSEGRKDLIGEEILQLLEPAKHKAEVAFEAIRALAHHKKGPQLKAVDEFLSFARKHIPEAAPRLRRLLLNKSAENIESFHAVLREVTPPSVSSPLEALRRALTAVDAAPKGQLRNFAIKGALRELASRWHEDDQVLPTAVPFSPALFGRQLRNYLNHLDEVSFFCSPLEIPVLYNLLQQKYIPLEQGARPRLRDPWWSRAENERLLRLVELKSDMFRHAREGELGKLQRLVENGADVSVRDCQDHTLLHAAAQGGQVHVVEWLLGLGAKVVDPLAKDWCGYTALHDAGTASVASALLAAGPVHLNGTFTPLHQAARCGRAEVVAVLLRDSRDLDAEDRKRTTPLHWAASHGHDQVVRLLLEAGARCQADADGHTPLVCAAISGSAPTVRLLLGATPPPADEDCWAAALVTARLASEEACFALLDELEARGLLQWGPGAREVLREAAYGGSSAIALRLLGLSPDALSEGLISDIGATVLHAAAIAGRAELVRTLLRCGADPLCEDAEGETALAHAAVGAEEGVGGVLDIVTALVERIPGGDLQALLARALSWAAMYGQLGTVQRLVHHGADVNAEGGNPLRWAARSGHTEVVRWLLQRGADPRLGEPLHMAATYGRLGVVKLLVPPLHGGEEGQGEPGSEEPSALRVAVQDGSREDVERILGRFVEHLRPLSSRYTKEDRLRDKAEATAALRRKEKEQDERLRLLQQLDSLGRTALHWTAAVSALPVVEYLLDREGELLRPVYSKRKNTGVPRLDGLSVYWRDPAGRTALQVGALGLCACAPSVAEALLKRMGDTMWMALGHKDLQEVRSMAEEALELATLMPDSDRLVRALCAWLSRSGEGLLSGEGEGLQDIRRRVLSRARWRCALRRVLRRVLCRAAPPVDPQHQRLRGRLSVVLAMRAYLQGGARGETAVQLLSQWLCDLSEDDVAESKVLEISEAVDVLRQFK